MVMADLRVFSYLTSEKGPLYRKLIATFVSAKERFILNLRSSEIALTVGLKDDEIETALRQLCEWGNLRSHLDTSEVSTIQDFYKPRYLYQFSKEGEAAEYAVRTYFAQIEQSGELQTAALNDILGFLKDLRGIWMSEEQDESKVFVTLTSLKNRFEELTQKAQDFMRSLQESIDIPSDNLIIFQQYKEMLINYLEKFMKELILLTPSISDEIVSLEAFPVDDWMERMGRRELIDALNPSPDDYERASIRWKGRWAGLRSWFMGSSEGPSQADILRARTRRAIPALLTTIQRMNDRRANKSDRFADYCTLAKWFAEAKTENEAHQIWAAAFNLMPTRHLRIDQEAVIEQEGRPVSSSTSWAEAPPVWISPRLRASGTYQRRGKAPQITSKHEEKRLLAARMAEELIQIQKAQRRLATGEKMKLTDLDGLSALEFGLFLDLLGEGLSKKKHPLDTVSALSTDGSLEIILEPIEGSVRVTFSTEEGDFSGPNHWITVRESFSEEYSGPPSYQEAVRYDARV